MGSYVTMIRVVTMVTHAVDFCEPMAAAGRKSVNCKRTGARIPFPWYKMVIAIAAEGFVFIHVTYVDAYQQR